ncbi:MAG: peptidase C45 acyl-coenzyme A:6-aminopenicillanic acid acyl-transferase [Nitrospirae bacterium]|nr:MAG: peptidase C45 acyl-coenzyme A:6-aminopenicillanic acid acyl-transferase [Nitrospirota bacterium]
MQWGSVSVTVRMLFAATYSGRAVLLGLFFFCSSALASNSDACTLWAAAGASVDGKGTLIVKNRDWTPDHRQELRIMRPEDRYASLVLVAVSGDEPGTKAGMNEKGLVIVSATAGQLSRDERNRVIQKPGLINTLLAECATVADVLKHLDRFRRPVFYLVADRTDIAFIEVAPDGRVHVERRVAGMLAHTNHYLSEDVRGVQRQPDAGSVARLERIEQLLKAHNHPFSVADFIRFSKDNHGGPDNSIWRTGSTARTTRTLATWLVSIPPKGSPQLYLKTADPGRNEKVCQISLNEALSTVRDHISLNSDLCKEQPAPR